MKSLPRRESSAPASHADARVRALAEIIRDEYVEMSDMALTVAQACTLWSADPSAVVPALNELVDRGVLRLCRDRYVLVRSARDAR